MTDQQAPPAADVGTVGILTLVLQQLGDSERRITGHIDQHLTDAARRWRSHDEEHHDLATAVKGLGERVEVLEQKDHDERVAWAARIGPLKRLGRVGILLARHWPKLAAAAAFAALWLQKGGVS